MKVIYTAIFGRYEELKEPALITQGWDYYCFTDQPMKSNCWRIISLDKADNPILKAREIKISWLPESEKSLWVDGSFIINCNLDEWWNKHFLSPMTVIKHPVRDCYYAEAVRIASTRQGYENALIQAEKYKLAGVPLHSGLIQSGILMRENTSEVREFCSLWWEQIKLSTRDQIGFAYAEWKLDRKWPRIRYDYRTGQEFIYKTHYHKRKKRITFKHRSEVINYLIKKYNLKSYLEIGVYRTKKNFDLIKCPLKIGVDPAVSAPCIYRETSDEFFEKNEMKGLVDQLDSGEPRLSVSKQKFDVIFIDGLHHAAQVQKDFDNSLKCLNEGGFILLHDTNPKEQKYIIVPRRGSKGRWNGDVYRFMFKLHKEYDVDFRTLDFDSNGLTVVKSKKGALHIIEFPGDNWETFAAHRNAVLKICTSREFRRWL